MPDVNNKSIMTLVIVVVAALVLYGALTMPDQRTATQRVGDAIEALPDAGKAAEQLERRTPGERLGDAVKDATDNK